MKTRRAPLQRILLAALTVAVGIYAVRTVSGLPIGPRSEEFDNWLFSALELAGVGLVWWRVAHARQRLAWAALALYATLWWAGDFTWTVHFDHVDEPPFPNVSDAFYLVSYVFAYLGFGLLLRRRTGATRLSLWLDGLIGGLAIGAICADVFLSPVVTTAAGSATAIAVTLSYPVLDLLLLCMVGIAFGVTNWRPGPAWAALGGAMAVSAIGDAAYTWQQAVGNYDAASWVNLSWPVSMALLAWAAWLPDGHRREAITDEGLFIVPAAFAALSLGVLVTGSIEEETEIIGELAAAGSLVASGVRAWLTHRENVTLLRRSRQEALEDGLTGLPNRRQLMADIGRALGSDRRSTSLAFFDLDGFKSYNDNFGHGAGDALLERLAHALAESTGIDGVAYRLGGDEFCVLFEGTRYRDDPAVARAAAALGEDGEGFTITSSYGLVSMPREAPTASAALQLADERMYGHKGRRRGSPGRQGRDLLMQILREREPELEEHVDDVGALALAVGRQLGLGAEALDEIARAAELHDIGKIAIPEAILHKPGPLDDDEWHIMRQHTIVGERILAAAPSLRPVARLVRSSHERWDGGGYPDGLADERIPLGARIIAVCDAFDAMRQARPYAASMGEAEALAELRRCAGSQFDPLVVDAFAAVIAAGTGPALRVA